MRQWRNRILAALVLCLCIGGIAGFAIARGTDVTVMTGRFYVGDHEASGPIGEWTYGIVGSVPWVDSAGSWHEDGWPACLGPAGTDHTITFGETTVNGPTSQWREVLWVSCPR
jgi:hypothetical protein